VANLILKYNNPNRPMHLTTMPSALLSQILRTQDLRQKQVVAGDRGRSAMKRGLILLSLWFAAITISALADELLPTAPYVVEIKPLSDREKFLQWGAHCDFTRAMPDGTVSHVIINSDQLASYLKENHLSSATLAFSLSESTGRNLPFKVNNKELKEFVIPGRIILITIDGRRYFLRSPHL